MLAGRPARDYAVTRCVEAWHDLGTERPVGFAVGAIPESKIWQWCSNREIDRETTLTMVHVIRRIDVERAKAAAAKAALDKATGQGAQR